MFKNINIFNNKRNRQFLINLSFLIYGLAMIIGLITRLTWVTQYNHFFGDQARDASWVMDMWQGKILYYGPPSSVGGFGIFPYYYYLNFVFSIFGPNPVYQALSNAIFSFLSIPLLGLTLFRLIEGEVVELKLFFSSIGSFIWSLMAVDIFFSNQEWNPNSIPFFILSFSLIIDLLGKSNKKYLKTVYSILLSFITIYLLSLHSTTLFIMPIALLLSLLVLFTKKMISSFEIFVVFISCVLLSIPYLVGEIPNQFSNTKIILKTIFKTGGEPKTLFSRLDKIFTVINETGKQVYFLDLESGLLFFTLLLIVFVYITLKFKGNKVLFTSLSLSVCLFLLAVMSYSGVIHIHYIAILWVIPLMIFIISLNLAFENKNFIILGISIIFICMTLTSNLPAVRNIYLSKFGEQRTLTTRDMELVFEKINFGTTICVEEGWLPTFIYYSKYVYKSKNISPKLENDCQYNDYAFLPKVDNVYLKKTMKRSLKLNSKIILFETDQFQILKGN